VVRLLSPVLWPLAVAGVLAYLLDPVVDFIESKGATRSRSILCVFVLALAILVALFGSVVPQIVQETRKLSSSIPVYVTGLQKKIEAWVNNPPKLVRWILHTETTGSTNAPTTNGITNTPASTGSGATNVQASPPPAPSGSGSSTNTPTVLQSALQGANFQDATTWLAESLPKVGTWLFGQVGRVASWFGVLAGLALVPVYTFYFLLEKKGISSKWTDYLPVADSGFKKELVFVLNSINNYLVAFFRGQVLVAICDGFMYTVGFLAIGLPYAVLIGAIAVFLTMIPFLGAIVTCVAALIVALVQWGDWVHPLLVLGVFAIVQALEGLVVSPKIMGDRVGLHPVTIIIAVMAGTTLLGGILGGILAIPLTAALRVLMFRYVWKRRGRAETA
jgi:predicted PurR-regulated permease PerM